MAGLYNQLEGEGIHNPAIQWWGEDGLDFMECNLGKTHRLMRTGTHRTMDTKALALTEREVNKILGRAVGRAQKKNFGT